MSTEKKPVLVNPKSTVINHIPFSFYSDIHVVSAGYEKTSPKKPPRELTDSKYFSIHYVLSGAGYLSIGGKTMRIEKDHVFFLIPGIPLVYFPDKKTPWKYTWIDFVGTKANEFLKRMGLDLTSPIIKIRNHTALSKLFLENVTDNMNYPDFSDIAATASFYKILFELFKQQYIKTDGETQNFDIVKEATKYISANYSNPDLSIRIVASHAGVNQSYLSRLIKKTLSITFTDYVTRVRLNAALQLMDNGENSISTVAYAVGFSDPYYFSNVFKKNNSISPREHLKIIRKLASEKTNTKSH